MPAKLAGPETGNFSCCQDYLRTQLGRWPHEGGMCLAGMRISLFRLAAPRLKMPQSFPLAETSPAPLRLRQTTKRKAKV